MDDMNSHFECLLPTSDIFQLTLMELVRDGVLIVSQKLQPVYLNLKARDIFQRLWKISQPSTQLPPILSYISHQLLDNDSSETKTLLLDYPVEGGQPIRIRAWELSFSSKQGLNMLDPYSNYILVFLEDRNITLNEELKIEQKKYDLTERETQILHLLSQTYSYQEISSKLQVSLNTVKFHVKNINSKKRSQPEDERKYFRF
jgi:DNA-binding CsgD family transcriptional regulator